MIRSFTAAATAAIFLAGAAQAQSVTQTADQLGDINIAAGVLNTTTTTTNANGRTTTSSGLFRYSQPITDPTAPRDVWRQQNVGGGGTVGITDDYARSGDGSAFFASGVGNYKSDLEIYFSAPVALSSVTALSYDAFRDASSTTAGHFTNSLRMMIGNATGAYTNTYLIFEPVYNGFPVANPIAENSWYTFGITGTSTLFANNGNLSEPAGTGACAGCYASFDSWKAANSTLTVIGLSTGIGSGWGGTYRGAVDNVSFTAGGNTRSWSFEVAAAGAVPEPASWAMMIVGIGAVGAAARTRRRKVAAIA